MKIGSYLKKLRKENNYTLNDVAEKTKMSVSLISQLENDKASPSLNSLQVLLRFYGVGLSAFFDQVERNDYLIVKNGEAETFNSKTDNVNLTFLASKLQNTKNVSFKTQLKPKAHITIAQLDHDIQGERFMFVITGQIEVTFNRKEKFSLATDDSVLFRSSVSCKVKNPGKRLSMLIITGTPPLF